MSLGSAWPARAIIKGRPEALGRLKNGRIYNATPNKGSLICSLSKYMNLKFLPVWAPSYLNVCITLIETVFSFLFPE